MKIFKFYTIAASALILAACSHKDEWTVKGHIEGGDGKTMILEASSNGRWYPIDSVRLTTNGKFALSEKTPGYPDIYRLKIDNNNIYFPIDSTETVSVEANLANFSESYTISGSESAEKMMDVEKLINSYASKNGAASLPTNKDLKKQLGEIILSDPAGIVTYYLLNKKVEGVSIYNSSDKSDVRIIGAVANAFDHYRPTDPRTAYLKTLFLSNRTRTSNAPVDTLAAAIVPLIDINLYDYTGKQQTLSEAATKNKVVILSFTDYSTEQSPAYNVALNNIYEKYHKNGLEIYQVAIGTDEYQWKQSAKNLPWITVYNPTTTSSNLRNYNVTLIPTTYIIANGEILERIDDITDLQGTVARYF